jgi:hypothetical protein
MISKRACALGKVVSEEATAFMAYMAKQFVQRAALCEEFLEYNTHDTAVYMHNSKEVAAAVIPFNEIGQYVT